MIEVVVVDDEKLAVEELSYLLNQIEDVAVLGGFTDANKAFEFVCLKAPDLIFLDINMPVLDGMAFADALNKRHVKTKIVFATAYDDYALKAFEKKAFDYVMKPYDALRILSVISRYASEGFVKETLPKDLKKLAIWKGERVVFVDVSEIIYCEVINNQTYVYSENARHEIGETLSSLAFTLPNEKFLRIHRNYIINLEKVIEASPYFNQTMVVKLRFVKEALPVSRHYVKAFKDALNIK